MLDGSLDPFAPAALRALWFLAFLRLVLRQHLLNQAAVSSLVSMTPLG